MDHKALLTKYILFVRLAEGTDFLENDSRLWHMEPIFSDAEWEELQRLKEETVNADV